MLKFLRHKNVSKIVLWGILILILPAFVIWGTGSLSGSKEKGPKCVGTVSGKKVSFEEFAGAITGTKCQVILNYFDKPETLDALLKNRGFVAKLAWDRIIMLREAGKYKLRASDNEVSDYIRSHPIFMRNGSFDPEFYQYVLNRNIGIEARSFEEIVRENIILKKLRMILTKDISGDGADEKALEEKREKFLEDWLRRLESQAPLNIKLEEYEKYYR